MGRAGVENGALLQLAADNHFDVLISNDRGLEYEHNPASLPLTVIVLLTADNKLGTLNQLIPAVLSELNQFKPRTFIKIESSG